MASWAELSHTFYSARASWAELCHTFYFAMRNEKYETTKSKTNMTPDALVCIFQLETNGEGNFGEQLF